ncbi:HK97-gp10 family putative phage morphogenesis protein [Lactiplantibacillus modestisalitolerans]|uniref:HK97-gp10 family putative phage morphogenesis protein n=1 Tax=Lactiplantibacillus modestisalitolerans TaxID=1457219 RepID=A0ABV5WX65_9LACO|nr:HK97-gp10 family putative phage morphogenesis protein [Lactiplantibacillus modestisalitolerans]
MSGTSIRWDGLGDLYSELGVASREAQKYTEDAMKSTLAKAQQKSKGLARVDTGFMQNNINTKVLESNQDRVVGEIRSEAEYSSYNEFGTYKMSAKPFIRPSVAASTPWFYNSVKQALKKAGKFS